jgi:SAM-dependent MidA family methyltransferase
MDVALYAPEIGFYNRPRNPLGPEGDYYTAPRVSPLFGQALALRIRSEFDHLGRPNRFRILELGPGDGVLAESILAMLKGHPPEASSWEYGLVERSPHLAEEAAERVARLDLPSWLQVRVAESIGGDGSFRGIIVGNEYLDALPFRRAIWRQREWRELGLRWEGEQLRWTESSGPMEPVDPPLPPVAEDGTVFDFSPWASAILREIADHLKDGTALFVDYGAEESELLRAHRHGTLAAYRNHRLVDDPLQTPGEVDLSAFVNFTRLRASATRSGQTETAFRSKAIALREWGFAPLLEDQLQHATSDEERVRLRLASKNLLFGFDTFHVWELAARGLT